MKQWLVVAVIEDDGMEDPSKEVKGKYFTKKELLHDFLNHDLTAGLRIKMKGIILLPPPKTK